MNNQHHPKKPDFNYDRQEKPAQHLTDSTEAAPFNLSDIPQSQKSAIPPKMNVPFPLVYPKRQMNADRPPHIEKPKEQQIVEAPEEPSSAAGLKSPQTVIPARTIPAAVNHPKLNPPKACDVYKKPSFVNPSDSSGKNQWWLEYDEYLSKFLK